MTTTSKLTPKERHFYRMGIRLNRTGGWNTMQVAVWCAEQRVTDTDRLWAIKGCKDAAKRDNRS
jgi:hypothetical protein